MDTNQLDIDSAQRSRIWRSKEARAVRDALTCCVERGVLRDFSAGKLRLGRMTFTAACHCDRNYRMLLDVDAATLTFSGLFPGLGERSPLFKQLKNFLRPFASEQVAAPLRVDPCKGEIQLLADDAGLMLRIRVKNGEFEHCAGRLVRLAEEVFSMFLRDGRYHPYATEAVGRKSEAAHVQAMEQ